MGGDEVKRIQIVTPNIIEPIRIRIIKIKIVTNIILIISLTCCC
jgi:hypothetical protein